MPPAESSRTRDEPSLRSGNVAARKGSEGRRSHSEKMMDSITISGASGMTKLAAKLLKADSHTASQITAWRPASPRQMTVTSWGRCRKSKLTARIGITADSTATSRSDRETPVQGVISAV
ncbi:hypothetical protein GCM10022417_06680 [Corynebacterium pilbarense]